MAWERRRIGFALLAFLIVLTPSFYLPIPGLAGLGLRAEQFMIMALLIMGVGRYLQGKTLQVHISDLSLLLLSFTAVIVIAIVNGYFHGIPVIARDFTEVFRFSMSFALLTAAATFVLDESERIQAVHIVHICVAAAAVIAFTQYFNLGGINEYYVPTIAPVHYITLVGGYPYPRVVGMSANPNQFAYMSAVGTLLGAVLFVRRRHWGYLLTSFLTFVAMLMTRSRTGFVTLLVMLVVLGLLHLHNHFRENSVSRRQQYIYYVLLGVGVPVFLFGLLYVFPHSFTWRLRQIFSFTGATSWLARLERWQRFWLFHFKNPILGSGPAKGQPFGLAVDNEWLLLLKRYGIVGVGALLGIVLVPIGRRLQKLLRQDSGMALLAVLAGSATYMITGGVLHVYKTTALLMVVVGALWGNSEHLMTFEKGRTRFGKEP